MADTRCPHCDHTFGADEITDGWCAECGKKIPEVVLKHVRPRPAAPPAPLLPDPTAAERTAERGESKVRGLGFLLMLLSLAVGGAAVAWAVYSKMNRATAGREVGWVLGLAVAVFMAGLTMLVTGRLDN